MIENHNVYAILANKFRKRRRAGKPTKNRRKNPASRRDANVLSRRGIDKCGQIERARRRIKTRGEKRRSARVRRSTVQPAVSIPSAELPVISSYLGQPVHPFPRGLVSSSGAPSDAFVSFSFVSFPRLASVPTEKKRTAKLIESILCAIYARSGNTYPSVVCISLSLSAGRTNERQVGTT